MKSFFLPIQSLLIPMIVALIPAGTAAQSNTAFAPVAYVNDALITGYDVEQQRLLTATVTGNQGSFEEALEGRINDLLKQQAAQANGITLPESEVDQAVATIAQRNSQTPEALLKSLGNSGISPETLREQLKTELLWRSVIRKRFEAKATPSDAEVAAAAQNSPEGAGTIEYEISEIVLSASAQNPASLKGATDKIHNELKKNASFAELAQRISQGSTADAGGKVGWIPESALPPQVTEALGRMTEGQVSPAINLGSHIVFVLLHDRRVTGGGSAISYQLKQIVIAGNMKTALDARARLKNCDDIDRIKQDYLPLSGDLGTITVDMMPAPVRNAVLGMKVGGVSAPIKSNDGIHLIMLCGKSGGPDAATQQRLREKLIEERFTRFADAYFNDLRRDAVIERY